MSRTVNDPVVAAIRTLALEAFEHGNCSSARRPFDSDLIPEAWAKKIADDAAKQAAKVVAAEQEVLHAIAIQTFPLWREAKEALATLRYIGERDVKGVLGLLARSHVGALRDAIAQVVAGPSPDGGGCAGDFADQLPKGPAHGRFTDAERAELDALKRKAFEAAKPTGGA